MIWSHTKKNAIYGPGLRFVSILHENGTVSDRYEVTRVGSATDMKSNRSEFIFRPVPCKRMKRSAWRPIRTHTGLSSSRSHVITPLDDVIDHAMRCLVYEVLLRAMSLERLKLLQLIVIYRARWNKTSLKL